MKENTFTPDDFAKLNKDEKHTEVVVRESISAWKDAWFRLRTNKIAMISLIILVIVALMAAFGPMITEQDYQTNHLKEKTLAQTAPIGLVRMILDEIFSLELGWAQGFPCRLAYMQPLPIWC